MSESEGAPAKAVQDPETYRDALDAWMKEQQPNVEGLHVHDVDMPRATGFSNETVFFSATGDEAGEFQAIVEEKDATEEQRRISEVNMSYYVFDCRDLLQALGALRDDNAQGEYYITDVPGLLKVAGKNVQALPVLEACEAMGVNTQEDLAAVEKQMSGREPVH